MSELLRLFRACAENSALEMITLKAVGTVCVLLQRLHVKTKLKDNKACLLVHQMVCWKQGKIDELLFEGHSIEQRLCTSRRSSNRECRLAHASFVLMLQGNSKANIPLITKNSKERVLLPGDPVSPENPDSPTVLEALKNGIL